MADGDPPAGVRQEILDAVRAISAHPRVVAVDLAHYDPKDGSAIVSAEIDTNLPSRWRDKGVSVNGVQKTEVALFALPAGFPGMAPVVLLRQDFPRNLPHIYPDAPKRMVHPCIYFGDLTDFMHRAGVTAVVHLLAVWLEKAACNELIDKQHGWEPIRRDNCSDLVEFDATTVAEFTTPRAGFVFLRARLLMPTAGDDSYHAFLSNRVNTTRLAKWLGETSTGLTHSVTVVAWSNGPPAQTPVIASHYAPDAVETLGDLVAAAESYGCAEPLKAALEVIEDKYAKSRKGSLPIVVILCARRPVNLIHSDSSIELIPYVVKLEMPNPLTRPTIEARAMAHRHRITPALAATMSGLPRKLARPKIAMLGCGSLGSKLSLHQTRAGVSPAAVIDDKALSPHNAARHALIPAAGMFQVNWRKGKAEALASALAGFGPKPAAVRVNPLTLPAAVFFALDALAGVDIIVNTTGSAAVRSYLAAAPCKARVIEAGLLAGGAVGVMAIEGEQRNPSTADLALEALHVMTESVDLCAALNDASATLAPIGQGCGSLTMVMPDSKVSLHAAAMGQRLLKIVGEGMPVGAELLLGRLGDDEMSLTWSATTVPSLHVISTENAPWTVRISERAHQKILNDVRRYPHVETGGVAIGRASILERTIWVTDVWDAPPDSTRSAGEFKLGVDGLATKLDDLRDHTHDALRCVGTWHSHLADHGGSPRDYRTAAELASSTNPLVLLIRRPSGYSAVLADRA